MNSPSIRHIFIPRSGICINNYVLKNFITATRSAMIFVTSKINSEEQFVIKMVKCHTKNNLNSTINLKEGKNQTYELLHSDYIIKCYDSFIYNNFKCNIMEYARYGDLYKYIIKRKGNLSNFMKKKIISQMIKSFQFLHSNNICHRDIKPENYLIVDEKEMKIVLSDFDFACYITKSGKSDKFVGTTNYTAPEILEKVNYGIEVDIWSLGVSIYYVYYEKLPFEGSNKAEVEKNIKNCSYEFPFEGDEKIQSIIRSMLVYNPEERSNIHDINF
ncbi:CAMK family protein kinase [Tritrichomonas foetus]|uniref:CAMK family protein kinase n=1 Tax=Tritrichomonas foetus TaxID=1144522 RepID=A0A1J4K631_9EUKA|nr:CAMK family protein kinase [Tritrichomonas foetus]|eukprot:OHT04925.1 CAMK family protein kinase [Tritrichomonas foetus]